MKYTKDNPLRVVTLCSGYDSQCVAIRNIGIPFDLVAWSEIDKHAITAHNALFPEYADRNLGDMTKIDWENVPDFDLLFYSTPCQSVSSAGLQHGFTEGSGTRSSIIWNVRDAVKVKRPKYLALENVKNMVSKKFVGLFNLWQEELTRFGYTNFAEILNSKDYGIPQHRARIFLVSIHGDAWYQFPQPIPLRKKLMDLLEEDVDEKYYISQDKVDKFLKNLSPKQLKKLLNGFE